MTSSAFRLSRNAETFHCYDAGIKTPASYKRYVGATSEVWKHWIGFISNFLGALYKNMKTAFFKRNDYFFSCWLDLALMFKRRGPWRAEQSKQRHESVRWEGAGAWKEEVESLSLYSLCCPAPWFKLLPLFVPFPVSPQWID